GFRHLLVRDVAYSQIPRATRAARHRAAAEWVEALGRPEDHAEMLASHYLSALEYARAAGSSDAGLTDRARIVLRDAGERAAALNSGGHAADAIQVIEEALPAAERLGLAEMRARLLELRGTSRIGLGDDGGFADLDEAISLATEARAFTQLHTALNNRATREVSLGRLDEARRTLLAMQANLENDPNIGTRRWVGALAVEMNFMQGGWDEAMRLADEWVAEADAGSTHLFEPAVRMVHASMLLARGRVEEALGE